MGTVWRVTGHTYLGSNGEPCMYQLPVPNADYCGRLPSEHAVPSPVGGEAVYAFTVHADAVLQLVRKKDQAYGGAWQQQGYMGNLARIMSKTARLQNMLWNDADDGQAEDFGESVNDTLHDLMALAAFMATNIEDGNRWGR